MPGATDDTATLTLWAIAALRSAFKPGFRYVKAGVMLDDIRPRSLQQGSLFDALPSERDEKRERLMGVLDKANRKWGRGTMGIGSAGMQVPRVWTMQRDLLSPRYTTRWDELRKVSWCECPSCDEDEDTRLEGPGWSLTFQAAGLAGAVPPKAAFSWVDG